jgi:hypothetical protein
MDILNYAADATALARQATLLAIAQALALAGAIACAVLFLSPKRRGAWRGVWRKVSEHVNFDRFLLSSILKFLYVFAVLSTVIYGLFQLFTGAFLSGVIMIIAAPLGIRVLFELLMLLMSIREETSDTNDLLRRMQGLPPKNPPKAAVPEPVQPPQQTACHGARQGRMQPDPRYAQQQAPAFTPQGNGAGGYTAQPRVQPQPYTDYSPSQRYAPVRQNGYAGYDAQAQTMPPQGAPAQSQTAPVVRPTPADGTGRFQAVPMREKPDKN